jgi:hypothetical protein
VKRHAPGLGALGCLLAAAGTRAQPAAATLETTVGAIEAALAAGDDEKVAELLLEAEAAIAPLGSAQKDRLRSRLAPARARVGTKIASVRQAHTEAAGTLLAIAEGYARRGWQQTAQEYAAAARRLDPEAAEPFARRARERTDDRLQGVRNELPRLFGPGASDLPHGGPPWRQTGGSLFTARLADRNTIVTVTTQPIPAEFEACARFAPPDAAFKLALLFGYRADGSYFCWEVYRSDRDVSLRLFHYDGDRVRELGGRTEGLRVVRQFPAEMAVAVRPRGVRCTFGPAALEIETARLPRPAAGGIGFFVSGDSTWADEIEILSLTLEG